MLDKSREPDVAISLLADDSMADHGMVLSEVPRMPQPPTITSPSEGSQHAAFFDVLIEGTCDENATSVELLTPNNTKWADAAIVGSRWFAYRIWGAFQGDLSTGLWLGWLGGGAGTVSVKARQTVDGVRSQAGNQISFEVGYQIESPIPTMTLPVAGSEYVVGSGNGPILLGGCGSAVNEREPQVDVFISTEGGWMPGHAAVFNGTWFSSYWHSYPITSTFRVRQTVNGFMPSQGSAPIAVKFIAPDERSDDSPATGLTAIKPSPPSITTPLDEATYFLGERVLVMGTCEDGATMEVEFDGNPVGCKSYGTNWYTSVKAGFLSFGLSRQVRARQQVRGSEFSDWSDSVAIKFIVASPKLIFPTAESIHEEGEMMLSGLCDKGATVEIINPVDGRPLGRVSVAGTTWVCIVKWDKGQKHVAARQIYHGHESAVSQPVTFTIQ